MEWTERLNRSVGRVPLGTGTVEVLHWTYNRNLSDNRPHRHTFFEVCQVGKHGRGDFIVQDKRHPIGPGDLFIARPGVIHQIVNTEEPGMELRWVSFQWTPGKMDAEKRGGERRGGERRGGEADSLLRGFSSSPILVARRGSETVAALWSALEAAADAPPSLGGEALCAALAAALLLGIGQAGTEASPLPEPGGAETGDLAARLAVRFIHDNLNRPLPLLEIAGQVHSSPRHLSRLFARFTGKSIAQYITHARMDRAGGLILRSGMPLKEVAAQVGYPDVHHFTRVFASHFGLPPGEMRRHPDRYGGPNIQNPGDLV